MKHLLIVVCLLFANTANASLVGDQVFIDRRDENRVIGTTDVIVADGFELRGWQSIIWDFYDYGVKLIATGAVGYFPSSFNGFDIYDLDFGSEYETISGVDAYFISASDGSRNPLPASRLSFSDHSLSINLGGRGLASSPLYIDISTTAPAAPSPVPVPAAAWLFVSALGGIGWLAKTCRREKI